MRVVSPQKAIETGVIVLPLQLRASAGIRVADKAPKTAIKTEEMNLKARWAVLKSKQGIYKEEMTALEAMNEFRKPKIEMSRIEIEIHRDKKKQFAKKHESKVRT